MLVVRLPAIQFPQCSVARFPHCGGTSSDVDLGLIARADAPGKERSGKLSPQSRNSYAARAPWFAPSAQQFTPIADGLLRRFDDGTAGIMAAIGADDVRRDRRAALGAILQLPRFLEMMSPPATGSGIRMFSLGDSHKQHPGAGAWPTLDSKDSPDGKPIIVKLLPGGVKAGAGGSMPSPGRKALGGQPLAVRGSAIGPVGVAAFCSAS